MTTFEKVTRRMLETFLKKNADYAGDKDPYFNFEYAAAVAEPFTNPVDRVFATLLGVKLARLAVLKSSGAAPKNEPVADSHMDLSTYAAIWEAWGLDGAQPLHEHDIFDPTGEADGGLAQCLVCNGAEGSLPTECPGQPMTSHQDMDVYADRADFVRGAWVYRCPDCNERPSPDGICACNRGRVCTGCDKQEAACTCPPKDHLSRGWRPEDGL